MLALLTWLNPLWAYAAIAAVGIPLIAHILSQQGGPVVDFPTVRFLRQAMDETRRRTRLRDLLLLLLRCLALGLIVAAFARPSWTVTQASPTNAAGIDAYFVLDRTASMTRTQQGATLFDEARQRIVRQLRSLDPQRDRASVIVLDRQPRALLPAPSASFSRLIELVENVAPGYERGNVPAALRQIALQVNADAASQLASSRPRPVQVHILTDAQATQWPSPTVLAAELPRHAAVRVQPIGEPAANLSLHRATLTPAQPAVGQPAQVDVELACFAARAMQPVAVTIRLTFEGRSQVQVIQVPANAQTTASFIVVPSRPGVALIELSAESQAAGDTLRADDHAGLAVTVVDQRPVILVTAAKPDDANTAAFFVERALAPQAAAPRDGRHIALTRQSPGELAGKLDSLLLGSSDALKHGVAALPLVVIVEAGALESGALAALHRYVSQGGAAVWFVDSAMAVESWRQSAAQLAAAAQAATPAVPLDAQWLAGTDVVLAAGRFEEPILRVFAGPARAELLRQQFRAVMRTKASQPLPLLSFSDGSPALMLRFLGAGRLATFAADVSPRSSDWVKGPSFAPLLHQLVHHLSPAPSPRMNPQPGEVVDLRPLEPDARTPLSVFGPTNEIVASTATPLGRRFTAAHPGRHTLAGAEADSPRAATFVEIEPDESDLRIAPAWAPAGGHVAAAVAAPQATLRTQATELWPALIAAAIALLVVEVLLIHFNPAWFRRIASAS